MGTLPDGGPRKWELGQSPQPPLALLVRTGGRSGLSQEKQDLTSWGRNEIGRGWAAGQGVSFHAAEAAELPGALPSALGSQAELRWSGP